MGGAECVFFVFKELANCHTIKVTISSSALFSWSYGGLSHLLNHSGFFDSFGKYIMAKVMMLCQFWVQTIETNVSISCISEYSTLEFWIFMQMFSWRDRVEKSWDYMGPVESHLPTILAQARHVSDSIWDLWINPSAQHHQMTPTNTIGSRRISQLSST